MGTQGIVSIVDGDNVLFKIITGADGYNADQLVGAIKNHNTPLTLETLYQMALDNDFGGEQSLVVLNATDYYHRIDDVEELPELYRSTFNRPEFNPRWRHGTAAYVRVVVLATGDE